MRAFYSAPQIQAHKTGKLQLPGCADLVGQGGGEDVRYIAGMGNACPVGV
jgi:hypothetical protein